MIAHKFYNQNYTLKVLTNLEIDLSSHNRISTAFTPKNILNMAHRLEIEDMIHEFLKNNIMDDFYFNNGENNARIYYFPKKFDLSEIMRIKFKLI